MMDGRYTLELCCDKCQFETTFYGDRPEGTRRRARLAGWVLNMAKLECWCRQCKYDAGPRCRR